MTLKWIDSMHELATLTRVYPGSAGGWGATYSGANGTGRDGVANGAASIGNQAGTLALPSAASGAIILGWAWNLNAWGNTGTFFSLYGDSGVTVHLTLNVDASGHLTLRLGGSSGTIIATSTSVVNPVEWHYFEMKATIADAGGTCIVRVDGIEWINFTGDTKNAGTATAIDTIKVAGAGNTILIDDLYVCDTSGAGPYNDYLGDISVKRLFPNGDGATNQFVGSDGNSVQNYLLTDENPANTTDYTGSVVVGQRDLYALDDLPASAATVYGMQAFVTTVKTDAGARSVKVCDRGSATVRAATAQPLSTTYIHYASPIYTTDGDGAALTPAVVNAVQVGAEVV